MNNIKKVTTLLAILGFSLSTVAIAEINDGIGHKIGSGASAGSTQNKAMDANHPPVNTMGNNHPSLGKGTMPTGMPKMPEGPTKQGKVIELTSGAGYSYMHIESGGQKFWIAGTQVSAKVGDIVSYVENVRMNNFTSKTLNRTFDSIVFASTVSVVQ